MISANYFDGASARMHSVKLQPGDGAFVLNGDAVAKSYDYRDARMAEPFSQAPCVIDFADGSRCEVSDAIGKALVSEALGYRQSRVVRLQQHWYGALLALVLLAASIGAFVQWGVPALAERIVAALPVSVDQRVGDQAQAAMQSQLFVPSRLSDQRIAQVQEIFRSIVPKQMRMPVRLKVLSMPQRPANAFALPNGTIVMTDQMILLILDGETEFDDDKRAAVAGILAHEIGHVEGRHAMRAIVRSSALALGSATLFGDFSNVVAGAPVLLLNLNFSREMEAAADDYAIARMKQAGLSTVPLADLFEVLEEQTAGEKIMPPWMRPHLSYLSSHPATEERIKRFRGDED